MFGSRLKEERLKNQLSQEELAERLDVKKNTVWNWENEKSYPNALQIMDFLDFGFDVQYILTGTKSENNWQQNNASAEYDHIPCFDEAASAGFGSISTGASTPANHLAFRKDWLKNKGLYARNLACLYVRGDSMEPTISNSDTILVNTAQNSPRDGNIYVIRSSDTLWVKRIQKQFDGSLLLISDNHAYPPMTLVLDDSHDVQIIGQVVQISKDLD